MQSMNRIGDVAIVFTVQSLERTFNFYTQAIGLQLEKHEGYLLCTLKNGTEVLFFEGEAKPGTSPQIVFGLSEGGIDDEVEALASSGVQLLTPVTEAPGGWSVEFADPDGHPIAYYQAGTLPRKRPG
jgi:glyoxylase I family protein